MLPSSFIKLSSLVSLFTRWAFSSQDYTRYFGQFFKFCITLLYVEKMLPCSDDNFKTLKNVKLLTVSILEKPNNQISDVWLQKLSSWLWPVISSCIPNICNEATTLYLFNVWKDVEYLLIYYLTIRTVIWVLCISMG